MLQTGWMEACILAVIVALVLFWRRSKLSWDLIMLIQNFEFYEVISGGWRNTDIALLCMFFISFTTKTKQNFKWCWKIKWLLHMCHWFCCSCIWNKYSGMFVMVGHQRNRGVRKTFKWWEQVIRYESQFVKVSVGPVQKNLNIELNNCCCLVAKSCLTLCSPMDYSTPSFPVLHYLLSYAQTHVHWVGDHFSSCPQSFFPSIRVFSNETALSSRWPK